jgi:hypothetical protein
MRGKVQKFIHNVKKTDRLEYLDVDRSIIIIIVINVLCSSGRVETTGDESECCPCTSHEGIPGEWKYNSLHP